MTRILVIGGYGAVGQALCRSLGNDGSIELFVAGRNLGTAQRFAAEIGAVARSIDLLNPVTWPEATDNIDVAIVCMDQNDTKFVQYVMERCIQYIDLSANDPLFREIEELQTESEAAALLSVGLAPGMTNLLALACAKQVDQVHKVSIGLMGGTGDAHGKAGIAWLVEQLFDLNRSEEYVRVDFGPRFGIRRALRIAFPDQFVLIRRAGFPVVTTSVCLDSRIATASLLLVAKLFKGSTIACRLVSWVFEHCHIGSNQCIISLDLAGSAKGTIISHTAFFHACDEANTTGRIAAIMVRLFLESPPTPGVWHSHEILDVGRVLAEIEANGIGSIQIGT